MGAAVSIETFLLFAAVFIVVMTVLGVGAAILAYRISKKNMEDFERRRKERKESDREDAVARRIITKLREL